MKNRKALIILPALVLIACLVWFFSGVENMKFSNILNFGIILLILIFAVLVGFRRFKSFRDGGPAEDELSKKILAKAASMSYYISLYLWLAIMYFSDRIALENHTLIGFGIIGMAVVFGVCWLVINFAGLKNE